MSMKKFIAPKVITINGKRSPCECNDATVCSYCVQANLILIERENNPESEVMKAATRAMVKFGVRKTARLIGEYENSVRRWISKGKMPKFVLEKWHKCTQGRNNVPV